MKKRNNIFRIFAKYVSLNILSMIGLSCYILADTYFISSGVGSAGIAALNLVLPIYCLFNGLSLMLGMGAAIRFSILSGQGKEREASQYFTYAILLGLCMGGAFTLAGFCFSGPISALLGADGDTLAYASEYLKTLLSFCCAFFTNQILVCFVRNDKAPNLAMAAMLAGSFGNIILDYIFIFPLNMGMFGAALATGCAPIMGIGICLIHCIKKKNHFHFVKVRFSLKMAGRIASLGMASFINEISSGITMLIFNFTILEFAGSLGVAAYGIIANLALVVIAVFTGVAQGIQPVVSTSFGEHRVKDVKRLLVWAIGLAAVLGVCFYLSGRLFAEPITAIFNKEGNPILFETAVDGIHLYFSGFIAAGINIVCAAFFAAISKPFPSFLISILRGIAFVIPAVFLLSWKWQMTGVWLAVPCAELLTVCFSIGFLSWWFQKIRTDEQKN